MRLVDAINSFFMQPILDEERDKAYEGDQMDLELDEEDLKTALDIPMLGLKQISIEQHKAAVTRVNQLLDGTRERLIQFQTDSKKYVDELEGKIIDAILVRDAHQAALNVLNPNPPLKLESEEYDLAAEQSPQPNH